MTNKGVWDRYRLCVILSCVSICVGGSCVRDTAWLWNHLPSPTRASSIRSSSIKQGELQEVPDAGDAPPLAAKRERALARGDLHRDIHIIQRRSALNRSF